MRALLLSIAFVSIVASTVPVYAQTRVALVIGNGAYVKVPRLDNPKNDASAMEAHVQGGRVRSRGTDKRPRCGGHAAGAAGLF